MFGYITANRDALTEDERKRFRACYCGLCHSLKKRHGIPGRLALSFDMTPYAVEASPHVHADAGRIAIMRGPVVYCVEAVDNGEDLRDLHIDFTQPLTVEGLDFCGLPTLQACGWRRDPNAFGDRLYRRVGTDRIAQTIKLIPYFACANRGETEMIVWILPA